MGSWDEKLFEWLHSRRKESRKTPGTTLALSSIAHRLEQLGRALTGEPFQIRASSETSDLADSDQPFLDCLFLPELLKLEGCTEGDLWKACFYRVLWHHGALEQKSMSPTPAIHSWLLKTYAPVAPVLAQIESLQARYPLAPLLRPKFPKFERLVTSSSIDIDQEDLSREIRTTSDRASEMKAHVSIRPEIREVKKSAENPMVHFFEKVLTAEEYSGGSKRMDGSDEAAEHSDAVRDLKLKVAVISKDAAGSVINSESILTPRKVTGLPPSPGRSRLFVYPEWFRSERTYRKDFCHLIESDIAPSGSVPTPAPPSPEARRLKNAMRDLLNRTRVRGRSKDGFDLDLDSIVRWRTLLQVQRMTGAIEQRVFLDKRRLERDLAILLLCDASMSTDGWIGDEHIATLIQYTLCDLGWAFEELETSCAIAAFRSQSRLACEFHWAKHWQDSWKRGIHALNGIRPGGHTRIGPAIRHAVHSLSKIHARRKIIVLITDAKPSDYDQYEGQHGIADVRRAIEDAHAKWIHVHGVVFSSRISGHLTDLFGPGRFDVIRKRGDALNSLGRLLLKIQM